MPWTSLTPLYVWAVIFLPMTVFLFRYKVKDRLLPILILLAYLAVQLYFLLTVNWSLFSYLLRFLPLLMAFIFLIRFIFRSRLHYKPWLPERTRWNIGLAVVSALALVGASYVDSLVLKSYSYPEGSPEPVLLQYPLRTGMYVFTNAGNGMTGVGMNNSYQDWLGRQTATTPWQAYAVDAMEMRTSGMVSSPVMATSASLYEGSLNEPIRAPCPGEVVFTDYSHKDVRPFSEPADALGNRVVIKCQYSDYFVTVSNMRFGNDFVNVGDRVSFNNIIGYIGVSGTPAIPHLHLQANLGGWDENAPPVPISFEFSVPVRNQIFIPTDNNTGGPPM